MCHNWSNNVAKINRISRWQSQNMVLAYDYWILDSGSSRHLCSDESWLEDAEDTHGVGNVTLRVSAAGETKSVKLTEVYFAVGLAHNSISYGKLDAKGYSLGHRGAQRVFETANEKSVIFDVELFNRVLTIKTAVRCKFLRSRGVILVALVNNAGPNEVITHEAQRSTQYDLHRSLGHLNYDAVKRLARDPASGIHLIDRQSVTCSTFTQGKQNKKRQPNHDTCASSPIDRIGGVISSTLKGPMKPRDRLGNCHMINFVDHKSNYVKVFLA
uniref:Uncharacterized protein AlNc14C29G2766 n=1 Tax=Albugo laibachii Nc14 TaxID=890382 RepID=F0W7E9_9STRA|nr:conserved hypothetical protein [Albugo laibachii Nc14]|eukprot:CCA17050.1 conserved hypothetical protein [Albugo laibachii Nc14]